MNQLKDLMIGWLKKYDTGYRKILQHDFIGIKKVYHKMIKKARGGRQ
jgi:hypothetical protein